MVAVAGSGTPVNARLGPAGRSVSTLIDLLLTLVLAALVYAFAEPHDFLARGDLFMFLVPFSWIVLGAGYVLASRHLAAGLTPGEYVVRLVRKTHRRVVIGAAVGAVFTAPAWGFGPLWGLLLCLGAALAVADLLRGRARLRAGRSSGALSDGSPARNGGEELFVRMVYATMGGGMQVAGLLLAQAALFAGSPLVSAGDLGQWRFWASLLLLGALGYLPDSARPLAVTIARRSTPFAGAAIVASLLFFALAAVSWSLPAATFGLLAAAVAFELVHATASEALHATS